MSKFDDQRYLTREEKAHEIAFFDRVRQEPDTFRTAHPEAIGGEGFVDPEVLPLVDALNEIEGLCTIQSCCGHVNAHGFANPGHLWLRLSEPMTRKFDERIGGLIHRPVIVQVKKLYSFADGFESHEVIEIFFHGEAGGGRPGRPYEQGPSRMDEAGAVILPFFQSLWV